MEKQVDASAQLISKQAENEQQIRHISKPIGAELRPAPSVQASSKRPEPSELRGVEWRPSKFQAVSKRPERYGLPDLPVRLPMV